MSAEKSEGRYFPRGPEIIPRHGTWQRTQYEAGRRFYEPVLDGQHFPPGATPKELDRLANVRAQELGMGAAVQVVEHTAQLEQPPTGEKLAA